MHSYPNNWTILIFVKLNFSKTKVYPSSNHKFENMNNEETLFLARLNDAFYGQRSLWRDRPFNKRLYLDTMTDLVLRSSSPENLSPQFEFLRKLLSGRSLIIFEENTSELRKTAEQCLVFAKPNSSPSSFFSIKYPRDGQKPNTPNGLVEIAYTPGLHLVVDYCTTEVQIPITWQSDDMTLPHSERQPTHYEFGEDLEWEILMQLRDEFSSHLEFFPFAPSLNQPWKKSIMDGIHRFRGKIESPEEPLNLQPHPKSGHVREIVSVFKLRKFH